MPDPELQFPTDPAALKTFGEIYEELNRARGGVAFPIDGTEPGTWAMRQREVFNRTVAYHLVLDAWLTGGRIGPRPQRAVAY